MNNTFDIPSPCYVLDEAKFVANLRLIQRVKEEAEVDIVLAFKGFAMWSVFPLLKKYVHGAAVSSLNELRLCIEKMDTKTHTYCVAYHPNEFGEIAKNSSHITFNSLTQYNTYKGQVPDPVKIGLRVNPEWSNVSTQIYNPSSPTSRLGICSYDLVHLPKRVDGLHFHVLCESDSYALEKVLVSFKKNFGHLMGGRITWVNMGGGHLITGKEYHVDHLISMLKSFKATFDVELILELGSAFAWQAGDLHTTVLDIVKNGGIRTAIIDASFTCHMPDCLEMPYRPKIKQAFREETARAIPYRIGGVSCLAGDYLNEYWFENKLVPGDSIIFKDMMHYTMVKTTMFNGTKHPSIGILKTNGQFELVKTFEYEAYRDRLS